MPHNHPTPLPRVASAMAESGWHVFPLVPGGKRPVVRNWEQRATVDPERIARCWSTGDYNIGIATGPSGLLVVDLDVMKPGQDGPPEGAPADVTSGEDSLASLAALHGQPYPSDTYTVRTPSGGAHLYFTAPEAQLRNTAGTLGWKIDTRARGGYVVGAGSVVEGHAYTVVRDQKPAHLPNWLASLLVPPPLPPQRPVTIPLTTGTRYGSYLRSAVAGELERVAAADAGGRNEALYQASVALGQLVAGGALRADEVTDWLLDAAVRTGLPEGESGRTIASGFRAGAKRPRTIGGAA